MKETPEQDHPHPHHHHHHVITIKEVEEMEEEIKQVPKLLSPIAGNDPCCIFRFPQILVEINEKAYQPQLVSIGPYHHGKPHLNMVEEHKRKYLSELLARTPPDGLKLHGCLQLIAPLETRIRDSYSEAIDFSSSDLIKMMVLDGLFIIEFITKCAGKVFVEPNDPIFNMVWFVSSLPIDLLLVENQIPFFVLQTLFEKTRVTRFRGDDGQTLESMFLRYSYFMLDKGPAPDEVLKRFENLTGKHLLDIFRLSLIPPPIQQMPRKKATCCMPWRRRKNEAQFIGVITSAMKLKAAGIKFKAKKADSFLDIGFRNGVLEIPRISINEWTIYIFLNSVAFEQCYSRHSSMHMTAYVVFMGFLYDQNIIENHLATGDENEMARVFNNLRKKAIFDFNKNYLSKVFGDVNEYYRDDWHVQWAGFKHTYFNTPWSFLSSLAALILLILTLIQAIFAVYPYAKKN